MNQSKAVKVFVDKWFVNKGCGFGRAPTGEIVVIHASAVQGADFFSSAPARCKVLNCSRSALTRWCRWRTTMGLAQEAAERDKEREKKVAHEVRRAAALTAELAAPSEEKVCATNHRAFVESSLSTLRRLTWMWLTLPGHRDAGSMDRK